MQVNVSHPKPVRIVLFRAKKEYLPYRPGEVAAAYYVPGREADLIVLVAGNEPSVAIHEYVHLLVRHSEWPACLDNYENYSEVLGKRTASPNVLPSCGTSHVNFGGGAWVVTTCLDKVSIPSWRIVQVTHWVSGSGRPRQSTGCQRAWKVALDDRASDRR